MSRMRSALPIIERSAYWQRGVVLEQEEVAIE
jgi:hypothetical protein